MTRRGFTLLEMLVALVVAAVVLVAALRAETSLAAAVRGRAERAGAASHLRAAVGLLRFELASLGIDPRAGSDLAVVAPGRVVFRAHRGLVPVCGLGPDSIILAGRLAPWKPRIPVPVRDSILLLAPGDSAGAEAWLPAPLLAGPTPGLCPGGLGGQVYRIALDSAAAALAAARPETVGRVFETIAVEGYGSAATWHFGQEGLSAGATLQPIAGPLAGPAGFEVAGWDRTGAPAAVPAAIAGLDVVFRVRSARELAVGPGRPAAAADSVRAVIRLGNRP